MVNEDQSFEGETYNISEGGLYMVSNARVMIGESYQIKLRRGETQIAETSGKVVWVNPPGGALPQGFGLVFSELDMAGVKEIKRYIKDQKSMHKELLVDR